MITLRGKEGAGLSSIVITSRGKEWAGLSSIVIISRGKEGAGLCVGRLLVCQRFYYPLVLASVWMWHSLMIVSLFSSLVVVVISNNGLLVRAITDILFYSDLIGTMVEIN